MTECLKISGCCSGKRKRRISCDFAEVRGHLLQSRQTFCSVRRRYVRKGQNYVCPQARNLVARLTVRSLPPERAAATSERTDCDVPAADEGPPGPMARVREHGQQGQQEGPEQVARGHDEDDRRSLRLRQMRLRIPPAHYLRLPQLPLRKVWLDILLDLQDGSADGKHVLVRQALREAREAGGERV